MDISRDAIEKPRFVQVENFVESRTNSIAQLLKAIDNNALVSGEVTKGPRTAAQRLPRHMRRRAMAYNVRRFPKGMREFAAAHIISKHRKKPPSRFARRKPANILTSYARRSMQNGKWLETHIWHAKRFRMVQRWGYKIADRSYQRGFRSILRDSKKNCVVRDHSYYVCILVSNPVRQTIINAINKFSDKKCGITSEYVLEGNREYSIQLYSATKHPSSYIGPARFNWIDNQRLCIWIHPASKTQFLNELTAELQVTEEKNDTEIVKYFNTANNTVVEVYENYFNRYRLHGPSSLSKLAKSIRMSDDEEFSHANNKFLQLVDSPSDVVKIPNGTIISISIEDPRTCWNRKEKVINKYVKSEDPDYHFIPSGNFWDNDIREKTMNNRMKGSEFQKLNGQRIEGVRKTDAKIVVNLIFRSSNQSVLDGIEVLTPPSFGKDLWVALQRRGVRASGLRDETAAHLESFALQFPNDSPDSEAGMIHEKMLKEQMELQYFKRPHNRRCKYWKSLSIKYPFENKWNELNGDWSHNKHSGKMVVCRDTQQLAKYDDAVKGKELLDGNHDNVLIPVRIELIGRGRPKKFGIICIPRPTDLVMIRRNRNQVIVQQTQEKPTEFDNDSEEILPESKRMEGFVSLDAASREKPIGLKALFEPSESYDDTTAKRKKINKKKKESVKRRKLEFERKVDQQVEEERDKQKISYRFSADREIIGRIVSGEQSVLGGRGAAIGFICASALSQVVTNFSNTKSLVLIRNSTSKYYHPATITVLKTPVQI